MRRLGTQPPLGGCVLKHFFAPISPMAVSQPPLGGCVLKPILAFLPPKK